MYMCGSAVLVFAFLPPCVCLPLSAMACSFFGTKVHTRFQDWVTATSRKLGCPTESLHGNWKLRSSTATASEVSIGWGFGLKIWRRLGRYHLRTKVARVKVVNIKIRTS